MLLRPAGVGQERQSTMKKLLYPVVRFMLNLALILLIVAPAFLLGRWILLSLFGSSPSCPLYLYSHVVHDYYAAAGISQETLEAATASCILKPPTARLGTGCTTTATAITDIIIWASPTMKTMWSHPLSTIPGAECSPYSTGALARGRSITKHER